MSEAPQTQTTFLTLDQIAAVDDIEFVTVDVPEWKGSVKVKALTKGEHQACRTKSMKKGQVDPDLLELNLFCAGVAEPKFTTEDAGMLKRKATGPIERILKEILRVSGLDQNAVTEADQRFRD